MATFITEKTEGTAYFQVETSTGYHRIKQGGGMSGVRNNGMTYFTADPLFPKDITVIPCTSNGITSGTITYLDLGECMVSQFNVKGPNENQTQFDSSQSHYSGLTTLLLDNTQLSTFNTNGLSSLTNLSLRNNPLLNTIEGAPCPNVISLDMDGCYYLPSFESFPNLEYLGLNYCNITSLSFSNAGLSNLKRLSSSESSITSFNGNGLTSLTELNIYSNSQSGSLTSFDGTGMSSLTILNLYGNQLTSFNGTGLTSLTTLYLMSNPLTSFNTTGLSSLTRLNLSNTQLTTFNGTGLSNLIFLQIHESQLTTFDGTGLSNLTELYLMGNPLTTFIGGDMNKITSLRFSGGLWNGGFGINTLTSFDGNGLSGLTQLRLDNNQLTSFNGTGLTSLTTLYIENNPLTSFDGNGLSSLVNLFLANTQLTSFNGTGMSSLTYLNLDYNQLTSFDGTGLSSLTELHLFNNQLTSFNGIGLSSLVALYLDNNQLTSFDGNGLSSLTQLYLQNNQFTSFDGNGLSSLIDLNLVNNPLTSFNGTDLTSLSYVSIDKENLTFLTLSDSLIQGFIASLPSPSNLGHDKIKYDGLEQIKNEVKSTFEQRINAKSNIIKNLTKLKLLLSRIEEKPTDVGTINEYYYLLVDTTEIFNNAAPLYFTTELYLWKETLQNEKDLWDSMEGNNVNYGQAYYDFIINILNSNYVNEFGVGYELYNNLKAAWNTLSIECYRLISNRGYTTPNQEFISRMQESIRQAYGSAINKYAYFKLASDLSNGPWKAEAGVSEQYINLLKSATSNQEKIDEIDAKANSVINFFDNQSSYLSYKATLLSQFLTDFENVVIQMSYDTDALHTHAKEKGVKSIHPLKFVLTLIKFQVLNNIGDEPNSRTMGIFKELVDNGSWTVEQVNDFYGWLSSNISKFNTIAEGALNALANRQYSVPNTWSIVNNMDYRNSIAKFVLVEKEIEYYNELLSQYPTAILSLQNEISGMESEIYTLEIEKSELEVNNDTENPRYTEVNGLIFGLISDIQERNGIIAEKEVLITVETQLRDMLISDSSWYNNFKVTLNSILNSTALNMYDDLYDILTEFDGKTMPQYFNLDGIV